MDLLEDLKLPLLNVNFVKMYIIHKVLVLLKNLLNYLKDGTFELFFEEYNKLFLTFTTYNEGKIKF